MPLFSWHLSLGHSGDENQGYLTLIYHNKHLFKERCSFNDYKQHKVNFP